MKLHPGVRHVMAALVVLLLLALAFEGIAGGVGQWPHSLTAGQYAQSVAQVMYGVFAVLSIATVFRWRAFAAIVQVGFIVSSVAAASLAAVTWAARSYWSGVGTGVAALLIASLLIWMLRVAVLPLSKEL